MALKLRGISTYQHRRFLKFLRFVIFWPNPCDPVTISTKTIAPGAHGLTVQGQGGRRKGGRKVFQHHISFCPSSPTIYLPPPWRVAVVENLPAEGLSLMWTQRTWPSCSCKPPSEPFRPRCYFLLNSRVTFPPRSFCDPCDLGRALHAVLLESFPPRQCTALLEVCFEHRPNDPCKYIFLHRTLSVGITVVRLSIHSEFYFV